MDDTTAVLIAGAGPVGLALANDLARRGIEFRIVERLESTATRAKAHGLQGRTVEMLDMLDIAPALVASAQRPGPTIAFKVGDREIRIPPSPIHEPYPLAVPIMQQTIEEIFEAALEARGHRVERSTKVAAFAMDDDGVTVTLERADGSGATEQVRAEWLIACDGAHSVVRKELGLVMEGETYADEQYWLTECDVVWDRPRDVWTTFINEAGLAAAIWVEITQKWHVFVSRLGAPEGEPDLDRMNELFQAITGVPGARLENPLWIGTLTVNQRMPNQYVVGRAILTGDAAHAHTAAGGQGMNTGIQDAVNLGWKLALAVEGAASPTLVPSYEAERLPNARQLLKDTRQYHSLMFPRTRLRRSMTSLLFRSIARFELLQRAQVSRIGMFTQNHRGSTLTRTEGKVKAKVRAGDYLPHAVCRVAGEGGSLRDILKDPAASILVHAGNGDAGAMLRDVEAVVAGLGNHVQVRLVADSEGEAVRAGLALDDPRALIDGGGHVRRALQLDGPEIIYVRPDGYLGLRSRRRSTEALRSYLGTVYDAGLLTGTSRPAARQPVDVAP